MTIEMEAAFGFSFGYEMAERQTVSRKPFFRLQGRTIRVFGRSFDLPASRLARIAIGLLLIVGGCLSFLPVLGIWMLPLGFMVLSIDVAIVRRWRRRCEVRWSRWRAERGAKKEAALAAKGDQRNRVGRQTMMSGRRSRSTSTDPIS